MNRLTFGLTSLSKSPLKAQRFWQFCEEARSRGQWQCVHTHSTYLLFLHLHCGCSEFLLNSALPYFCCQELNIINWVTAPLLHPYYLTDFFLCTLNWERQLGENTEQQIKNYNSSSKFQWCVCSRNQPDHRHKLESLIWVQLERLISEAHK